IRCAQMHDCPPTRRNFIATAPSSAALKSASSNTMKGALPPSSNESRVTCLAAVSMIPLPTSVDPVKPILRISGCVSSSAPTSRLGEPAEVAERELDILPRLLVGLAVLERHEPSELVAPLLHQLLDLEEDASAVLGRQHRPLAERRVRGADRALDVGAGTVRDLRDD